MVPDTIGLYDPAASMFFLRNSNDSGIADRTFMYGPANFQGTPLAGAWNAEPTAASVSSTTPAGTYGPTTSIPITVTFSDPVMVPDGHAEAGAEFERQQRERHGAGQLHERERHFDAHLYLHGGGRRQRRNGEVLDYASTTALTLPTGSSIVDTAVPTTAADLTLPATGTDGLATQKIVIASSADGSFGLLGNGGTDGGVDEYGNGYVRAERHGVRSR